jgi:predicted metalloprotease with PDZ domain
MPKLYCLAWALFITQFSGVQKPQISYTLRIDSADLRGWDVELRMQHLPDTFRLAMAAHPEYDDRFYRYVTDVTVSSPTGSAAIARVDSVIWQVVAPGGAATVRYRLQLPEPQGSPRAAWRPFLTPTGGLTGGPHAFMYILGHESIPADVNLEIPSSWKVVTGLAATANPRIFRSASADMLVESPIFVGRFHDWSFRVRNVPHRVTYWPAPNATPFDTAAFVDGIARLVGQAVELFGSMPYEQYSFVFQDAAYGGLEHPNSVTLGAESRQLGLNPHGHLRETAHEFFHTWNLMHIRPQEYGSVTYTTQPPTAGLWFSEGLTIFYADLLLRRAALPTEDSTRITHLESLIARYLSSSGNSHFSAESISKVAYNAGPGALGDYTASAHLVGELLGSMLDLEVRRATNGDRSMDDVMRLMLERHGGRRGFTGIDIERAISDVCRCEVTRFFESHVRNGGRAVEFDRYLDAIGMKVEVKWEPALTNAQPERDLRLWGWQGEGEDVLRLIIGDPETAWGKAGLHTGDQLVSINGSPIRTWPELRGVLSRSRLGDTLAFVIARGVSPAEIRVPVRGYTRPVVQIQSLANPSPIQLDRRKEWLTGD